MGKILISLSDEVEEEFREEAGKRFGAKKGSLSKAARQAITRWMEEK